MGDLNADGKLDLIVAGCDVEDIVFWEVYRQHDYANVLLGRGDKTKEADETFFLNLSGTLNPQIADGQGKGTILNDDGSSTAFRQTTAAAFDAALDDFFGARSKKSRGR